MDDTSDIDPAEDTAALDTPLRWPGQMMDALSKPPCGGHYSSYPDPGIDSARLLRIYFLHAIFIVQATVF